jgi:hypothetical protein
MGLRYGFCSRNMRAWPMQMSVDELVRFATLTLSIKTRAIKIATPTVKCGRRKHKFRMAPLFILLSKLLPQRSTFL